jgi:rubrerythrin
VSRRKKKGPTPKRRPPVTVWKAACEACGFLQGIAAGRDTCACPSCGHEYARYVEVTL